MPDHTGRLSVITLLLADQVGIRCRPIGRLLFIPLLGQPKPVFGKRSGEALHHPGKIGRRIGPYAEHSQAPLIRDCRLSVISTGISLSFRRDLCSLFPCLGEPDGYRLLPTFRLFSSRSALELTLLVFLHGFLDLFLRLLSVLGHAAYLVLHIFFFIRVCGHVDQCVCRSRIFGKRERVDSRVEAAASFFPSVPLWAWPAGPF